MKTISISRRFFALIVAAIIGMACAMAQTEVRHTVQRGESLESIAQTYGVTVEALQQANPNMTVLYVGYKLLIPVRMQTADPSRQDSGSRMMPVTQSGENPVVSEYQYNPYQSSQTHYTPVEQTENVTPADFSCWYLSYLAGYDSFEHGYYGLGWITLGDNGWGATLSAHGSYGLQKPGAIRFYFGPAYGVVLHPNVLLLAQLRGYVVSDGDDTTGGIDFAPGLRLRCGKASIGAAFNFGWAHGYDKLQTSVEISIGCKF